jgi:hypothetical protein
MLAAIGLERIETGLHKPGTAALFVEQDETHPRWITPETTPGGNPQFHPPQRPNRV